METVDLAVATLAVATDFLAVVVVVVVVVVEEEEWPAPGEGVTSFEDDAVIVSNGNTDGL